MNVTLYFSDLHPDDRDFTRPDSHGDTGEELFRTFIDWVWNLINEGHFVTLVCVGDGVNCVAYLAEGLIACQWLVYELSSLHGHPRCDVIFVPGNHDRRLTDCKVLNYEDN